MADPEIRAALDRAYLDGSWGVYEGPHLRQLVAGLAEFHGVRFALPCCSGTFAVELALRGARVGPNDEVILAGYDFAGNFRSIEAIGATPVLVDIASGGWCLDLDRVGAAVGPRTRALVVSHLHGSLANMAAFRALADRHGLCLVEDACQATGGLLHGRMAGTLGDVGVLSFGGSKLLTAGRGGAILTDREEIWQRAKVFCERGNQAFPLSELQAAVLLPQLQKLPGRNERRRESVARLLHLTRLIEALEPARPNAPGSLASYYKLAWNFRPEQSGGWPRERWLAAMQAEGVAIDEGFRGFALRGKRCRRGGPLDHSERAAANTVVLHHPVLLEPDDAIERVARAFAKVSGCARRLGPNLENSRG